MKTTIFKPPRVDIVIPAFNASSYIEFAIESVVLQGSIVSKIIIIDDGSSDNTVERIEKYCKAHPHIRVTLVRQANAGPAAARNRGLSLANAEFVALLDADDVWGPQKLDKQIAAFDSPRFANLGVVYTDYMLISDAGEKLVNYGFKLDKNVCGDVFIKLLKANLIAGSASAVLIRRDCLERVGFFDEKLVCAEDWDLWLRLAKFFNFDYVIEELVSLRQHPNNSQRNELRMLGGELLFLNKLYLSGYMRWYHLWRIRRRLYHANYPVTSLTNHELCHPIVLRMLTGWRFRTWSRIYSSGRLLISIYNAGPKHFLKRILIKIGILE